MKLALRHETHYTYDTPVRYSAQYLRLTPRDTARQKVVEWQLETPGQPVRTVDGYGNVLHVLTLDKPVSEIVIRSYGVVQTARDDDTPSDFTGVPLSPMLFLRATPLTRADDKVEALAGKHRARAGTLEGLRGLAAAARDLAGASGPEAMVHVFLAACRRLGVPARYVSGYVLGEKESGAVQPHAWAEAWVGDRWKSFDVARDTTAGEGHVKIAVGADYNDACPIRGMRTGGGLESMNAVAKVEQ